MSYSRPDETWGYEPREAAPPPEDPAWGGPAPSEPSRSPRRRGGRSVLPGRGRRKPAPGPGATGEIRSPSPTATGEVPVADGADDHTMPPPSPHLLHRLPPLAVTVVVSGGLILGAQMERPVYAAGVAVLQLAMLVLVTWTRKVSGWLITLVVGAGLALAADWVAADLSPVSMLPITILLALAFGAAVIGQLMRREHSGYTESLGFTMLMCVAVSGYTCYIALSRLNSAPPAMYSAVVAAGTAILAARAVDLVMPDPRINRQVTRGAFGVVIGTMCGTASAAYAGLVIEGPEPGHAAIGGLLVALIAVLADLACGYVSASRRIDGDGTAPAPVVNLAGPLLAFAITGPVVYLLSAYYIID
ncbi:hypothetical protein [Glycomyces buryatensis]|uniref:Phosphatidate cytidylyltransferase n=1 Tax=Glycomyces buryatensis TaxID=2570927 RepID=A0A4S8QEW4_9ACTN|nr:hypothetical protein [Glycomyces buryatensis]THV41455.1 hypothetical protein FAB82_11695 [Glycomyces buryatensis]